MSSSDIAVSVRGLSKSYTIAHQGEKHSTLAETLLAKARNPFKRTPKETFWALKDVNFDIKKGEVVGIIGRNGAGKSTLLKILSRITEPTAGQIDLYGRVGSLLEVGTGFHPELTGRENVFLNGAILGMTKAEIRKQFDAIVDFAGVEKFLDTPVKRYSSGMYVRLAFAVSAHLQSEILIVDEVLAVGDAAFQSKCLGKMKDVSSAGRTVLFVSHNIAFVKSLCQSAIWLERGSVTVRGEAIETCQYYLSHDLSRKDENLEERATCPELTIIALRIGNLGESTVPFEEPIKIKVEYRVDQPISNIRLWITISRDGSPVMHTSDVDMTENGNVNRSKGSFDAIVEIPGLLFKPGAYSVDIGAVEHNRRSLFTIESAATFEISSTSISLVADWEKRPGVITPRLPWKTFLNSPSGN